MENQLINTNDLYHDIQKRCKGEIYIGIVGPVRTGKSTFIKRFMDLLVLPNMPDINERNRTRDELPQSGGGKTITTTEPKFIPNEAAKICLDDDVKMKVRLIDCVGYMVEGAGGHMENGKERMVKTPWFEEAIPFSQAAYIGTKKVICEHSTVGIVVVTDGSFSDLAVEAYKASAHEVIMQLSELKKPFIVLVNTTKPYGEKAISMSKEIEEKYHVKAMPINCEQLRTEDIKLLLKELLFAFPISKMCFNTPKWLEMLDCSHPIKKDICQAVKKYTENMFYLKDYDSNEINLETPYVSNVKTDSINLSDGCIRLRMDVDDIYYYELLSEILNEEIKNERDFIHILKDIGEQKREYKKVEEALSCVRRKGYGVVTPEMSEIVLKKPEVIKNGNKYGIKIIAQSPSIHLIKADIESEISPIVGTQAQAEDLIAFIENEEKKEEGIWETNIFGKTIGQLVEEGINGKISNIGDESQVKLQETMQKIVNESNGGMVCIII